MVVAAILADEEITQPETDFIKQILPIVKKTDERQELVNRIASKSPPGIFRPPGVPPKVLAAVFIELALVMISDIEFTDKERTFLEEVARVFRFTKEYYLELLAWCEEGLDWKNRQLEFVSATGSTDLLKVPVSKLNPLQQRWYAETLIASIMSDQQLDQAEVRFLKMAINLIKDEGHRKEVTNMVRRNRTPSITKPPSIPKNYLVRIFIEVMLIMSADESLAKNEHDFLSQLTVACDFSENLHNRLIGWCLQGMKWKQAKNPLIDRCQIETGKQSKYTVIKGEEEEEGGDYQYREGDDEQSEQPENNPGTEGVQEVEEQENEHVETDNGIEIEPLPEIEDNPDNNSITDFNMDCFVCDTRLSVKYFQLKEKSQDPRHNIFGIPIYQIAAEGFDPIDYNLCKVAVCHSCFFASPQRELFRLKSSDEQPPALSSRDFREQWIGLKEENGSFLKKYIGELSTIKRSLPAVVKSFQMAIKASSMLANSNQSHELHWHTITLRLTLAEVMMQHKAVEEAQKILKQIQKRSKDLFKTVKNPFITFRSGRLILLIAVYFGDLETANKYYEFFEKYREKRFEKLPKNDQQLFQRIYGEIKRIMGQPDIYSKETLNGFLPV